MLLQFFVQGVDGLPIIDKYRLQSTTYAEIKATIVTAVYFNSVQAMDNTEINRLNKLDKTIKELEASQKKVPTAILTEHKEVSDSIKKSRAFLDAENGVTCFLTDDDEKMREIIGRYDFFKIFNELVPVFDKIIDIKREGVLCKKYIHDHDQPLDQPVQKVDTTPAPAPVSVPVQKDTVPVQQEGIRLITAEDLKAMVEDKSPAEILNTEINKLNIKKDVKKK